MTGGDDKNARRKFSLRQLSQHLENVSVGRTPESCERQPQTQHAGQLVTVDFTSLGTLKGGNMVYLQSVLDCHSRYAWARFYTSGTPITAVHVLNTDVLPFFEHHGKRIETILSDNGPQFCGRPDRHPYELFLQLEGIEHSTTLWGRPESLGMIERFFYTLNEPLRTMGCTSWYETVDEMQPSLDAYLEYYNRERPCSHAMQGRTPYEVFTEIPAP